MSAPRTISTRNCEISLSPSGVVVIRARAMEDTLDDAIRNVKAVLEVSNGVKRPLMVDTRLLKASDKLTSQYYRGALNAGSSTALAFLAKSGWGKIAANI